MEICSDISNSICVLRLRGRFDSYGASVFDRECSLLSEDWKALILDFSEVGFLSSVGIRSLMKLEKVLVKRDGGMILTGISPAVAQVLKNAGLYDKLRRAGSLEQAMQIAQQQDGLAAKSRQISINGRTYVLAQVSEGPVFLEVWGAPRDLIGHQIEAKNLHQIDLNDLQMAFGAGAFGNDCEQALEALGEFITTGRVAGVIPADDHCIADFMVAQENLSQSMYVANAIGITGSPSFFLQETGGSILSVEELLADLFRTLTEFTGDRPQTVGVVIIAHTTELAGSHYKNRQDLVADRLHHEMTSESAGLLILGIAGSSAPSDPEKDPAAMVLREQLQSHQMGNGLSFHGHGLLVSRYEDQGDDNRDIEENLKRLLDLQDLKQVAHVGPATRLSHVKAWIYQPMAARYGVEKLLKIEAPDQIEFPREWEIIVRRIYTDAGKVCLTPIHGGYMSKTFHVASYDRDGRKMLPTVLKIGSVALTRREEEAYRDYVLKYILNNAATIMGTAELENWAGLRYNFVGIDGAESKLSWLTEQYRLRSTEELLVLFDRIFTEVLKPWYGQPKWEAIFPYREHDPTRLFPHILEDARNQLGMAPESETIFCEEFGVALPNPYHFLQHEYPLRKNRSCSWYKSVTHGDLNMQNILLDERDNIYVIDFSETAERNIVADFARLECILRYEMIRLETTQDLQDLVELMEGLTEVSSLNETPPFKYHGSDPSVEKAHRLICRLRRYADMATIFEHDIEPYLIALLEWTYPVVSYGSVGPLTKRLSAYSAALACRKLADT